MPRIIDGFLLAALVTVLSSPPAGGADRVDAWVGSLHLVAPSSLESELESLSDVAEQILPELSERLGAVLKSEFELYLLPPGGPSARDLRELDRAAPPWAAGYVFAEARVGAIRLGKADRYPYSDASSVLAHEIVHVLLHEKLGGGLPRWFEEGVASREALRWGWNDRVVLAASVLTGPPPPLAELDLAFAGSAGSARAAYAASFDFVTWAHRHYGDDLLPRLIEEIPRQGFQAAWLGVTGESLAESEAGWRRGVTWLYRWVPLLTASSTLWLGITALALVATWRRRAKTKALEAAWEAEELAPWLRQGATSGEDDEVDHDELVN